MGQRHMTTDSRPAHSRRTAAAIAAVPATVGAFVIGAATPAGAACAGDHNVSTDGNDPNRSFTIAGGGCVDLNFHEATVSQWYRGEYRSGTVWYIGSAGWISRGPGTSAGRVAISNIATGATARATGWSQNAKLHVTH